MEMGKTMEFSNLVTEWDTKVVIQRNTTWIIYMLSNNTICTTCYD